MQSISWSTKSESSAIVKMRSFFTTFLTMSDKSYQGRTCPTRDWVVSVENDVNIRWGRTCSTRPKLLANLGRNH
jgi:hypothetical protein